MARATWQELRQRASQVERILSADNRMIATIASEFHAYRDEVDIRLHQLFGMVDHLEERLNDLVGELAKRDGA
jgi:hypothetical protein